MHLKDTWRLTMIALFAVASLGLAACGEEDEAEEVGEAAEETVEEAGDAVENATE